LDYRQAELIFITVIYVVENLCGTDSIVVTERIKKTYTNSIASCKFDPSISGICFAKAG
jgi:hypothetical protein